MQLDGLSYGQFPSVEGNGRLHNSIVGGAVGDTRPQRGGGVAEGNGRISKLLPVPAIIVVILCQM
ncbi:MAG: hypothetical protein IPJ90_22110 [Anaerolineaceae bacterium]|nr:hypothetical protein [Anaerolineaceae bacterium]